MITIPLLPLEPSISKRLYNQNAMKILLNYKYRLSTPRYKNITVKIAKIDKFTIVEIIYQGHHYHGLSSRADCDKLSFYTGVAVAYNRAFKAMCGM